MKKMSPRNMERNSKATDRRRGVVQTCAKKTEDGPRVCIAGVTGAVGQEFLRVLKQRDFPYSEMKMLASARSAGKKVEFDGETYTTEELTESSFDNMDIALFSAGGSISKKFGPIAVEKGCFVVDNSSAFRMDDSVPLVVPEINAADVATHKGIIANPNCSTIVTVMALNPLHLAFGVKRIFASTYQAVSGSGAMGIVELERQVGEITSGNEATKDVYPHQIAFNVLPHVDVFLENGYTKEEMKMVNETRKILGDPELLLTATCVRVPVFRAHSESVNIEFTEPFPVKEAYEILGSAPGVEILEDLGTIVFLCHKM